MKKAFYVMTGVISLFLVYRIIYLIYLMNAGDTAVRTPLQTVLRWLPAGILVFLLFLFWFNRRRVFAGFRTWREARAQKKREAIERLRAKIREEAAAHGEAMGEDLLLSAGAAALPLMELYAAAQASAEALEDAADASGEILESAAENTGELLEDAAEGAGEALEDAAEGAGEALEDAAEGAGEALEDAAEGAGEALEDAAGNAGALPALPYIALLLFGRRVYKNTKQLREGRQTMREWQVNTAGDAFRIGAKTVTAKAGAAAGSAAGTAVAPGAGTVIGAGIGALAGAAATGYLLQDVKSRMKWGRIMEAQEKIGGTLDRHAQSLRENVSARLLQAPQIRTRLVESRKELEGYRRELDPYSLIRPTEQAVRTQEHCRMLTVMERRITCIEDNLESQIRADCAVLAGQTAGGKGENAGKIRDMLIGEFLIGNRELVADWSGGESLLMSGYDRQKEEAPNYPYQLPGGPKEALRQAIELASQS